MMMDEEPRSESGSHHVAWADRIGLNKQWARDIEACSDAFGTPTYYHMVRRFKNNIPNMRDAGPNLHDMITEYEQYLFTEEYYRLLNNWRVHNPDEVHNESCQLREEDKITLHLAEQLYLFIIQLLETNGFGFYKSRIDEVEEKMY
jgi:hypothetical protein